MHHNICSMWIIYSVSILSLASRQFLSRMRASRLPAAIRDCTTSPRGVNAYDSVLFPSVHPALIETELVAKSRLHSQPVRTVSVPVPNSFFICKTRSGISMQSSPLLNAFLLYVSLKDPAMMTSIPNNFKEVAACSRDEPHPKLNPPTIQNR